MLLASTVPPIDITGRILPLHVASVLLPGAGIYSLAYAALASAGLVCYPLWLLSVRRPAAFSVASVLLVVPVALFEALPRSPAGWVAVDAAMGQLDQASYVAPYTRPEALQPVARKASDAGARVVVLPEEMTGLWRDSTQS